MSVDVECSQFCFYCGGHNSLDELCKVENIPIVDWVFWVQGEEKMSTGSTGCLGFEVWRVSVYDEYHFALLVGEDGILVCDCIVEKLFAASNGLLGRLSLGWCNGKESSEYGGVYSTTIDKENTYHFLDEFLLGGEKLFWCVFWFCILYSGPVRGKGMLMGLVFFFYRRDGQIGLVCIPHTSRARIGVLCDSCSPSPWWFLGIACLPSLLWQFNAPREPWLDACHAPCQFI